MSIFEKFVRKPTEEQNPEEVRVENLRRQIKDLERERSSLLEAERGKPAGWAANSRIAGINQQIENLDRAINGLPPLSFNGSKR